MKIHMNAILIAAAILVPLSSANKNVRRLNRGGGCSPARPCGKCGFDCDKDEDCGVGLLCADEHKVELAAKGWNPRKADCVGNVGRWNEEVCFDEGLIAKLGVCEFDCDLDSDCESWLLCADEHKGELKAAGWDERKANCVGNVGAGNEEVCFDPSILED